MILPAAGRPHLTYCTNIHAGETWAVLSILRHEPVSRHLEVETYTWDVLPKEYRREDIVSSVARELEWVIGALAHLPNG